jgi:hypothetical protein
MTCKELHDYWESEPGATVLLGSDSSELAEHLGICPECNRFVEERKELAQLLQLVRDSAPALPASLDCAVLKDYRGYLFTRRYAVLSAKPTRIGLGGGLVWAAAVTLASVVAFGGMILFIPRQHSRVAHHVEEHLPVVAPQTNSHAKKEIAAQQPNHHVLKPIASVKRTKSLVVAADQNTPMPTRFRSLMYCDLLSCPGTMDIIRVQLPSTLLGVTPASGPADGFIYADVLVGPDGIARGIRVVE